MKRHPSGAGLVEQRRSHRRLQLMGVTQVTGFVVARDENGWEWVALARHLMPLDALAREMLETKDGAK